MQARIVRLDERYKGRTLLFEYVTDCYLDAEARKLPEGGFEIRFVKKDFDAPVRKSFKSKLMDDWLDEPIVYGAAIGDMIAGYLELSHEKWNNRLRIANILVEEAYRGRGIGRALMERAVREANSVQARAVVLETQSCNYPAMSFYRKCGFELIGCDLTAYSNEDAEKKEIRIEMALPL